MAPEIQLPDRRCHDPNSWGRGVLGDIGGNFYALDAATGQKLWAQDLDGAIGGGIITYTANGAQKIAVATGFTHIAWPTKIVTAKVVVLGVLPRASEGLNSWGSIRFFCPACSLRSSSAFTSSFPPSRSDRRKVQMMATIAPFWDGNETWLVVIGAGLYAAFPDAYGAARRGLYRTAHRPRDQNRPGSHRRELRIPERWVPWCLPTGLEPSAGRGLGILLSARHPHDGTALCNDQPLLCCGLSEPSGDVLALHHPLCAHRKERGGARGFIAVLTAQLSSFRSFSSTPSASTGRFVAKLANATIECAPSREV